MPLKTLKVVKYNVKKLLGTRLSEMMKAINRMFSKSVPDIGKRLKEIQTSMFTNDFLYNVLGDSATKDSVGLMREYFKL